VLSILGHECSSLTLAPPSLLDKSFNTSIHLRNTKCLHISLHLASKEVWECRLLLTHWLSNADGEYECCLPWLCAFYLQQLKQASLVPLAGL